MKQVTRLLTLNYTSNQDGINPPREDPDLEENISKISQELLENFNKNSLRWKNNLTADEQTKLHGKPHGSRRSRRKLWQDLLSFLRNG